MDAITMLKDDHKAVERLFRRYEQAGDTAYVEKREVVDAIIEALSVHASLEEQLFYPVARATVPGTDDVALESLEEHHIVKWVLSELESLAPQAERFDAKVRVLIENVRHHVKEEEGEFFPKVRDELGRSALTELGDAMAVARKTAPTHPHPSSPDAPPANLALGAAAGMADRFSDTVSGLAQGSVSAVADLIAVVLGRKRPKVSPVGSKLARATAERVRGGASEATDSAIAATRKAKRVGQRTLRSAGAPRRTATSGTSTTRRPATAKATRRPATAKTPARTAASAAKTTARTAASGAKTTARTAASGAKATATSARRSTKRVATTAKRASTTTGRTAGRAVKRTVGTAKRTAGTARRSA